MGIRTLDWTDEQAAAVTAGGDVLLAASAGTGKTTTVVGKILWMLGLEAGRQGQPPMALPPCPSPCRLDQIAAITFTEKAAYDLKRKLRNEIEASERGAELRWEIDNASVGTIHGFCAELLREHALRLEIDPTFRVLDERETRVHQDELLRDLLKRALADAEPEARALVRRFKGMYDRTHRSGAIGNIREVMRDIRWHSRRYAPWITSEPGADQRIDPVVLSAIAEQAGLVDPDPVGKGLRAPGAGNVAVVARGREPAGLRQSDPGRPPVAHPSGHQARPGGGALPISDSHHRRVPGHGRRAARHRIRHSGPAAGPTIR